MAIIGVGVDLASEQRLAAFETRHKKNITRLFSDEEIRHAGNGPHRALSLAAAFAAKEATVKALLNTAPDITVWDVSLSHTSTGAPVILLSDRIQAQAAGIRLHISITHDVGLAVAFCMAEAEL